MNCDYDEEQELCRYVLRNYRHALTKREIELERAATLELKARGTPSDRQPIFRRMPEYSYDDVAAICEQGLNQFVRQCYERLWEDHLRRIYVNRCERCDRIAVSPVACVCLWCGHAWFERRAEMMARAKSSIYPNPNAANEFR